MSQCVFCIHCGGWLPSEKAASANLILAELGCIARHRLTTMHYNMLQASTQPSVGAPASFMFLPPSLKTHKEFNVYKAVPHTGWGSVPGSMGTWNNNKVHPVGYLSFNSIGVEITVLFLLFITPDCVLLFGDRYPRTSVTEQICSSCYSLS